MRFRGWWLVLLSVLAFGGPVRADSSTLTVALTESLRSGRAKVGQTVAFEVAQDGRVGERSIPKGTPVYGTVTESRGAGPFGRAGRLRLRLDYAQLDGGERIPLAATLDGRGRSQSTAANVSAVLIGGTVTLALTLVQVLADAWDGGHRSSNPSWLLIGGAVGYLVGHLWRGGDISLPAGRIYTVETSARP